MIRILFVCHGNICRSVAAEMILKKMAAEAGVKAVIDSAATSSEEIGNDIYPPMKRELLRRGIPCGPHAARRLTGSDGDRYDLIIGMDAENMTMIRRILPKNTRALIRIMTEYIEGPGAPAEIADPWYTRDFATAVDQITRACEGILKRIRPVRVAAGVIFDSLSHPTRLFATERGYGSFKGQWEFPGGKIEPGESPEQALVRELREELNIDVRLGGRIASVEYDYPSFHLSMECFRCELSRGTPLLKEAMAARWLTRKELRDVSWLPADWQLLPYLEAELQDPEGQGRL